MATETTIRILHDLMVNIAEKIRGEDGIVGAVTDPNRAGRRCRDHGNRCRHREAGFAHPTRLNRADDSFRRHFTGGSFFEACLEAGDGFDLRDWVTGWMPEFPDTTPTIPESRRPRFRSGGPGVAIIRNHHRLIEIRRHVQALVEAPPPAAHPSRRQPRGKIFHDGLTPRSPIHSATGGDIQDVLPATSVFPIAQIEDIAQLGKFVGIENRIERGRRN